MRQAEGLVAKLTSKGETKKATKTPLPTDAHVTNLETKIREKLFESFAELQSGKGSLEISFFSDAELEGVLKRWASAQIDLSS